MNHQKDTFDILRLIAATTVLLAHHFTLAENYTFTGWRDPGRFAVFVFFIISGYLNALSLTRRKAAVPFLIARALRIYPALIVCVVATVLACAAFTTYSLIDYFLSKEALGYLAHNSTLIGGARYGLLGVFETNPHRGIVNGSLWTLPVEVTLYCLFALAMRLFSFRGMAIKLCAAISIITLLANTQFDTNYLYLAVLFFLGALFANLKLEHGFGVAITVLAAIAILLVLFPLTRVVGALALLTLTVIIIGTRQPPRWLSPNYDISYGVYLYAGPIQQMMVSVTGDVWLSLLFSVVLTFSFAIASCILIERPAIELKRRLDLFHGATALPVSSNG